MAKYFILVLFVLISCNQVKEVFKPTPTPTPLQPRIFDNFTVSVPLTCPTTKDTLYLLWLDGCFKGIYYTVKENDPSIKFNQNTIIYIADYCTKLFKRFNIIEDKAATP